MANESLLFVVFLIFTGAAVIATLALYARAVDGRHPAPANLRLQAVAIVQKGTGVNRHARPGG